MNEKDDRASVVKRRRVLAAKAAAEKEVADRELRSRRQKEADEERKVMEQEKMEKDFTVSQSKCALNVDCKISGFLLLVMCNACLRIIRRHDRSWIFPSLKYHWLHCPTSWKSNGMLDKIEK